MFSSIGIPGLLIIGGIVVLLFGAKRIPELADGLGKGLKKFKDAQNELEKSIEAPTEIVKKIELDTPYKLRT